MSEEKYSWAESAARRGAGQIFDPFKDNHSGWNAGPVPFNSTPAPASKPYRSTSYAPPPSAARRSSFGSSSSGYTGGSSSGSSAKGGGFLLLGVVAVVIYFAATGNSGSTPAANTSSPAADAQPSATQTFGSVGSQASVAKPNAGVMEQRIAPQPAPLQNPLPLVSTAPAVLPSTVLAEPAPAVSPSAGLEPWPSEGIRYEAERKGLENGCKVGTLSLATSGISFDCPGDPSKSFSAPLAAVKGLDNDGVELIPKGKYHFKIPSVGDKDAVHQLLSDWRMRAAFVN